MSNINFGRGYVYSIQYHIVWCVKYRRKILIDEIEKTLKELLIEISNENNIKIVEMETDLDHIHILIECSPQHFIPNISTHLFDRVFFSYSLVLCIQRNLPFFYVF